jgi:tRNA pseudouridine55 synthase
MSRRKTGDKVDGWVILDKPVGLGSTPAVGRVRRLFGAQKAGHGGTLDPLASGVLPIALGEATKTVPFVMDGRKEYRFTLHFGQARSTEDAEGEVTATSEVRPTDAAIRAPWRPSWARSSRSRRLSRRSRSRANAPTTWPGRANWST